MSLASNYRRESKMRAYLGVGFAMLARVWWGFSTVENPVENGGGNNCPGALVRVFVTFFIPGNSLLPVDALGSGFSDRVLHRFDLR